MTETPTPPTPAQIAQALCLVDCNRRGFAGCTWDKDHCLDCGADHFHDVAERALSRTAP